MLRTSLSSLHPAAAAAAVVVIASLSTVACTQDAAQEEKVEANAAEIVGGTEAIAGSWPGTVALYFGNSQGCGGALIADSWVVTAGHCILRPNAANGGINKVVINRHRLSQTTAGETRTVNQVIRHASFSPDLDNDIALLHLSQPSSAPKVKLITKQQGTLVAAGANVTVVGWGNTSEAGGSSDVLRQVTIPVISNTQCKTYANYNDVTNNMICAAQSTGGKDSCQGDSGGPLFQTINGQKTQVGIVSWGIGCARPNAPGVYTRLSNYIDWIAQKTNGAVGGTSTTISAPTDGTPSGDEPASEEQ
jgi:secreted trypsin-like serine protease